METAKKGITRFAKEIYCWSPLWISMATRNSIKKRWLFWKCNQWYIVDRLEAIWFLRWWSSTERKPPVFWRWESRRNQRLSEKKVFTQGYYRQTAFFLIKFFFSICRLCCFSSFVNLMIVLCESIWFNKVKKKQKKYIQFILTIILILLISISF